MKIIHIYIEIKTLKLFVFIIIMNNKLFILSKKAVEILNIFQKKKIIYCVSVAYVFI